MRDAPAIAMKLLAWTLALPLITEAAAIRSTAGKACTTTSQRKAWSDHLIDPSNIFCPDVLTYRYRHTLTHDEKLAYIDAEKCLMTLPAQLGLEGPRTRFDEFQKLHVLVAEIVHYVGAFLPFHRYLMHAHEHMLRTECDYTGAQTYWYEPLDSGNFSQSVVLDPVTGFGGNGSGPKNCITDGPFKDYVNAIGPFQQIADHCIDRNIDECWSALAATNFVDQCMALGNYSTFWPCLEEEPHSAGHGGVGGQVRLRSCLERLVQRGI